jgi:hypothetical protein
MPLNSSSRMRFLSRPSGLCQNAATRAVKNASSSSSAPFSSPPPHAGGRMRLQFNWCSRCTRLRGAEAQLHRAALLGPRILRLDRWSRRNGDQELHQEAGGRRLSPRSTEYVALSHLQVAPTNGVALATPMAALSGPIPKAPGFAGGYLPTRRPCGGLWNGGRSWKCDFERSWSQESAKHRQGPVQPTIGDDEGADTIGPVGCNRRELLRVRRRVVPIAIME